MLFYFILTTTARKSNLQNLVDFVSLHRRVSPTFPSLQRYKVTTLTYEVLVT